MTKAHPLRAALITGLMVGIVWAQWEARAFIEVNRFRRGYWGFLQTGWDLLPFHLAPALIAAILLAAYFWLAAEFSNKTRDDEHINWKTTILASLIVILAAFMYLGLYFAGWEHYILILILVVTFVFSLYRWWLPIPAMVLVWGLSWINLPPPPILPPAGDAPKNVADTGLKVLMFAVDGVDPRFLGPGMDSGDLPNLQKLYESGATGPLKTQTPAISPIVWTTIGTGKVPEKHGIEGWVVFRLKWTGARFLNLPPGHFLTWLNGGDKRRLVNMTPLTSNYRRCRAIWDIVDKVVNVGWWTTWPAEHVKGVMVTPYAWPFVDTVMVHENLPVANPPGSTWPDSIMERLKPFITTSADLKGRDFMGLSPAVQAKLAPQSDVYDLWYHAKDISFVKMFDKLLDDHPDYTFASVYIEGIDLVQHVFLRYTMPEWFRKKQRPTVAEKRVLGPVIPNYYKWVDSQLGELMRHADDHTIIVVVSDHGTEAGFRNMHYSGDHIHGPPGIVMLSGPGIKKGFHIDDASVEDIAPTLLYLLGYPVGKDMDGRVLTEVMDFQRPVSYLPTLDTGFEWGGSVGNSEYDPKLIERLKAIGYL